MKTNNLPVNIIINHPSTLFMGFILYHIATAYFVIEIILDHAERGLWVTFAKILLQNHPLICMRKIACLSSEGQNLLLLVHLNLHHFHRFG